MAFLFQALLSATVVDQPPRVPRSRSGLCPAGYTSMTPARCSSRVRMNVHTRSASVHSPGTRTSSVPAREIVWFTTVMYASPDRSRSSDVKVTNKRSVVYGGAATVELKLQHWQVAGTTTRSVSGTSEDLSGLADWARHRGVLATFPVAQVVAARIAIPRCGSSMSIQLL